MRWEDEPYVKVYTRDTPEFLALSWQARCLFHEILRKVDRAGILKVGKLGPAKGIAVAIRATAAELAPLVEELLDDGRIVFDVERGDILVPNHIEAQTANQSDAARQRKSRETARALVGAQSVTKRDDVSRDVIEPSRAVTRGHTESRIEEKRREEIRSSTAPPEPIRDRAARTTDLVPALELSIEVAEAKTGKRKRRSEVPLDFAPTPAHAAKALKLGVDLDKEREKFVFHHRSKGTLFVDSDLAFFTWLGNAADFRARGPTSGRPSLVQNVAKPGDYDWTEKEPDAASF